MDNFSSSICVLQTNDVPTSYTMCSKIRFPGIVVPNSLCLSVVVATLAGCRFADGPEILACNPVPV